MNIFPLFVLLAFMATCNAEAQQFRFPIYQPNFRAELPASSLIEPHKLRQESRLFFTTITVTFATSTSTSVTTISTTCTTSTGTLKSCSPSKGRRRRSHVDISGLLFNENEDEDGIDSNIFLIPDKK